MRPEKKSETVEVRLSHSDKQALQAKAARDGRTVSDIIRGLISDYIAPPDARSTSNKLTELFMTLKSKPKLVFAALAALPIFAAPFFLSTTANAGDISLTLESEYTQPIFENGSEGKRVQRANTEIEMAEGQYVTLPIASGLPYWPESNIQMTMQIEEESDQVLLIKISLCEAVGPPMAIPGSAVFSETDHCAGKKIIGQPRISAKYGETAEFQFASELPIKSTKAGDGETYEFSTDVMRLFKLKASPKKL